MNIIVILAVVKSFESVPPAPSLPFKLLEPTLLAEFEEDRQYKLTSIQSCKPFPNSGGMFGKKLAEETVKIVFRGNIYFGVLNK